MLINNAGNSFAGYFEEQHQRAAAGDPAKLAHALLTLAGRDQPPLRFVAGADAIEGVSAKARELLAQADASRELGGDLGHADA
ncbi:hypothetical protein [Streptomyces sp. NPDC047042]|uniref:hypothetical protein n=1 Tax=Streptomyces sp. NPDC047042 TaxID=3154807 RepID=UPI0033D2E6E9